MQLQSDAPEAVGQLEERERLGLGRRLVEHLRVDEDEHGLERLDVDTGDLYLAVVVRVVAQRVQGLRARGDNAAVGRDARLAEDEGDVGVVTRVEHLHQVAREARLGRPELRCVGADLEVDLDGERAVDEAVLDGGGALAQVVPHSVTRLVLVGEVPRPEDGSIALHEPHSELGGRRSFVTDAEEHSHLALVLAIQPAQEHLQVPLVPEALDRGRACLGTGLVRERLEAVDQEAEMPLLRVRALALARRPCADK